MSKEVLLNDRMDTAENKKSGWKVKAALAAVLTLVVLLLIIFRSSVLKSLEDLMAWIEIHTVLGPLILVAIYALCAIMFVPGSILTLGAGFAFKQAYGSVW